MDGSTKIYQAVGKGIQPMSASEWMDKTKKEYIFMRLRDPIHANKKQELIVKSEGIKYGFLDLLVHAMYILHGKRWWIGSGGNQAKNAQVCSEFVALVYWEIFPEPWKITTADIVQNPAFRVLQNGETLKTGDIAIEHTYFRPFSNPVSILSLLVRLFTRSYWNHCGVVVVESEAKARAA